MSIFSVERNITKSYFLVSPSNTGKKTAMLKGFFQKNRLLFRHLHSEMLEG